MDSVPDRIHFDEQRHLATMHTATKKPVAESPSVKAATAKAPDIASASVPDTLAALHVNPDTGLTHAEVEVRRKEHGYNEDRGTHASACRSSRWCETRC